VKEADTAQTPRVQRRITVLRNLMLDPFPAPYDKNFHSAEYRSSEQVSPRGATLRSTAQQSE